MNEKLDYMNVETKLSHNDILNWSNQKTRDYYNMIQKNINKILVKKEETIKSIDEHVKELVTELNKVLLNNYLPLGIGDRVKTKQKYGLYRKKDRRSIGCFHIDEEDYIGSEYLYGTIDKIESIGDGIEFWIFHIKWDKDEEELYNDSYKVFQHREHSKWNSKGIEFRHLNFNEYYELIEN